MNCGWAMQWKSNGLLDGSTDRILIWSSRESARRYRLERLGENSHLARIVRVHIVIEPSK